HQNNIRVEAALRCLSVPSADLSRLERRIGPGYVVIHLKRPQPGIYELAVTTYSTTPVTCTIAAFVKSPVRLKLSNVAERRALGHPIDLHFSVEEHGRPVHAPMVSAEAFVPVTSVSLLARQWKKEMCLPDSRTAEPKREEVERAQVVREHLRLATGCDPFQ